MKEDRIVLKLNQRQLDEYDARMMRLKERIRELKAEVTGDDTEYDEHPAERLEYEEFQTQTAANNKYVWIELPFKIWTGMGLKGGEWVKVKIALIPELNEEEKRAYGNAKMELFLKAVSESTAKI